MRKALLGLVLLLGFAARLQAQGYSVAQNTAAANPSGLGSIIFVDGVTYPCTSTGIQAAVTKANGGHVVLPSGTCSFDPSVGFSAPNGTWISGAGKYATTLRIPNGNNSTIPMVNINGTAPNNIYLSDFTIDGNAQNQTNGGPLIQVLSNGGKIRIERMVLQNSWADCFIALSGGSGKYSSDIEILGNEFNVCGHMGSTAGDVRIFQPLRVKVNGNKFNNSIALASVTFSSQVGAGQVEVANNHFVGGTGYGVVLGGGTIGASDGNVHDNFFSMAPRANQNVIDISYWDNVTIHHNHILAMGTCCNGISDLPPAFRTVVDGNEIMGSPLLITNSCIALGGNATVISHNYCQGAGGAGIVLSIGATSQIKGVTITDNIVKINSLQTGGANAGIETFLAPGGTASLSDVTLRNNQAYDDQASPTQGWGIGIAVAGQSTGYRNITAENNNVRGNKTGGIFNGAKSSFGFLFQNNPGDTNIGVCASNTSPAVCGVASAGSVTIPAAATTIVVDTTAVSAASKITVSEDSSLGTLLGVACNTTLRRTYAVTARTSGTSFTITASAAPSTNPACLNYLIVPAN
jgi:hypothetical protein